MRIDMDEEELEGEVRTSVASPRKLQLKNQLEGGVHRRLASAGKVLEKGLTSEPVSRDASPTKSFRRATSIAGGSPEKERDQAFTMPHSSASPRRETLRKRVRRVGRSNAHSCRAEEDGQELHVQQLQADAGVPHGADEREL